MAVSQSRLRCLPVSVSRLINDTALICMAADITSDCDADEDVYSLHHYKNHTAEQVVADVLRAGTDVDCHQYGPNFVTTHAG